MGETVQYRNTDMVAMALLLLPVAAGVALWSSLPTEMAIHFGLDGTVNTVVPKTVAIFLLPVIGIGSIVFTRLAALADPTADSRVITVTVLFLGAIIAYTHSLVLAYNLGYRFDMTLAISPVLVGAAGLVVYAFLREGAG